MKATALERGARRIVARTEPGGPIVTHGVLYGSEVAGAAQTDDTVIVETFANGDRIVRISIVNTELPPGGYVKADIFVAGVTFLDGTRSKIITAEDFDSTGILYLYLYFNYPKKQKTSTCHRRKVYDAKGKLVSSR